METRSSILNEIRSKNKGNLSPEGKSNSVGAMIGVIGSIIFIFMIAFDRPKLLPWIICITAMVFALSKIYTAKKKVKAKKTKINFSSIQQHQISRYKNWIKGLHYGHDQSVDQIVSAIDRDLKLASSRKFLGAHLLVGPKGTGKSQLLQLIGQVLFGKKNIIKFDFKSLDQDAFTNLFLDMLDQVSNNPHQLIILENADLIPGYMIEPFIDIFKTNQWFDEKDKEPTCFSGCLFIITASTPLPKNDDSNENKRVWFDRAELVDYRIVSYCSEIISWGPLTFKEIAKITGMQIYDYWKSHSIELTYVSPKAIFQILSENKSRENLGMHLYPQLIRNKSSRALEQAMRQGQKITKIDIDESGYFKIRSAA